MTSAYISGHFRHCKAYQTLGGTEVQCILFFIPNFIPVSLRPKHTPRLNYAVFRYLDPVYHLTVWSDARILALWTLLESLKNYPSISFNARSLGVNFESWNFSTTILNTVLVQITLVLFQTRPNPVLTGQKHPELHPLQINYLSRYNPLQTGFSMVRKGL